MQTHLSIPIQWNKIHCRTLCEDNKDISCERDGTSLQSVTQLNVLNQQHLHRRTLAYGKHKQNRMTIIRAASTVCTEYNLQITLQSK